MRTVSRERRWRWFVAWMLPGICFGFAVTAVGVFVVPVGLVLLGWLVSRRAGVAALGLLGGIGIVVAWIGSLNLDYRACSSGATSISLSAHSAVRSVSYWCGGVNGVPWLVAGASAVIVALALYLVATRSAPTAGDPSGRVGHPLAR